MENIIEINKNENENIKNSLYKLFPNLNLFNDFIFIYSPPKVGSTTLVSSLRICLGNSYNIIHIHDEIMIQILTGIKNISINDIINYLAFNNKNVYVIDIYRTPIERKISEYFEKISPYHFNNTEENINYYNFEKITNRFNKLFPYLENGDHYHEKYNIKNPINFDFENKYTIQIINNIKYIKLRLMDSSIWNTILSKIFNKDIFIVNDYLTENKKIGPLYKKFKQDYKIPVNFINLISNCKYLNFYLNIQEKNNYLNKWQNKSTFYFEPFSPNEYYFYMDLSLENQNLDIIQRQHYIDEGCICELCKQKRENIYYNFKNNISNNNIKIYHNEIVNEFNLNNKKNIISKINNLNKFKKYKNNNNKYEKNQFKIKL